jgi:Tol biopolymer transport system component
VVYRFRFVVVLLGLLFFLSACFQAKPPETTRGEVVFTDKDIDNAAVDIGKTEDIEGIEDSSQPQSEDSIIIANPISDEGLSTQAVLTGAKGFVTYVYHNPADTVNPWRIYRHNEVSGVNTLVYTGLRQITSVAVSGDGNTFLVSMKETTDAASDYEVYQIILSPKTVTQLTTTTGSEGNVSMPGNAKLYVWEGDGTTAGIRNIMLRNNFVNPATTIRLNAGINQTQPSISNDGRYIALMRRSTTNNYQVYLYNRITNIYSVVRNVTDVIEHPSVSNSGKKVAWLQTTGANKLIYVRDIQANTTTQILSSATALDHPHLAADGNYLTFAQQINSIYNIYVRNLATGQQVKSVGSTVNNIAPYWQFPDETKVSATIGVAGGDLILGNALIQVPANALSADVTFTIERLDPGGLPAAIPSPLSFATAYKFSSNATAEFNSQITMVVPVDVPTALPANQVITELYVWDAANNKYQKERIGENDAGFIFEPIKLSETIFVAGRATTSALTTACTTKGGQFNGKYCQLPFSSSSPTLTTQAVGLSYKVLSLNVGNFARSGTFTFDYCLKYAAKLCSYAVEERVREALVQANADIIAIQEVWHSDCQFVDEPGIPFLGLTELLYNTDKVCGPSSTQQTLTQVERLLVDNTSTKESKYEWRCTQAVPLPLNTIEGDAKTVNGYECIAVRKEFFELAVQSPQPIQPPCDPNSADSTQNYLGRDTGFHVETVRLKNPIGEAQYAEFDVVNAHMFKAFSGKYFTGNSAECRQVQLLALQSRYRSAPVMPAPKRLLIMGDFNTDPLQNANGQATGIELGRSQFNRQFSPIDAAIDLPGPYFKMSYLLSNPSEATLRVGIGPIDLIANSLDHVLSNFADGTCIRREPVSGLDHLSTLCTLTGFDSGTANFLMLLWNQDNPTVQYNLWNGIVIPAKKGVWLTYLRVTNPSLGRHVISGVPNNSPIVLEARACPSGFTRRINVPGLGQSLDPGLSIGLPDQRFGEFLSTCQ